MKKKLSLVLALVLSLAMMMPGLADTNVSVSGNTGVTEFEYTVAPSFTVVIPAAVTTAQGGALTAALSVTAGSLIDAANELSIQISASEHYDTENNKFRLECTTGTEDVFLDYTIKNGNADVELGVDFVTYSAANVNLGQTLSLTFTPGTPSQAGTYTGDVTFKVTVAAV